MLTGALERLDAEDREIFIAQQLRHMHGPLATVALVSALLFGLATGAMVLLDAAPAGVAWRLASMFVLLLLATAFARARALRVQLALGLGYLLALGSAMAASLAVMPGRIDSALAAFVLLPVIVGALWTRTGWMLVAFAACVLPPLAMLWVVDAGAATWVNYVAYLGAGIVMGMVMRRLRLDVSVQMYLLRKRLAERALSDPLTGVLNRRGWERAAAERLEAMRARGGRAVVAFFDLDHFKSINDRHGHAVGDEVLEQTAATLRGVLRGDDLVARLGGEEFVALFVDADLAAGEAIAERARRSLEAADLLVPVTMSAGVAELAPRESLAQAMRRADRALLAAKSGGRNRVLAETGGKVVGPQAPEPNVTARVVPPPRAAAITRLLTRRLVAG